MFLCTDKQFGQTEQVVKILIKSSWQQIHKMLGLEQALLGKAHPVCLEYPGDVATVSYVIPWRSGGCIIRVFPDKAVNPVQVFAKHMIPTSEIAQFLVALGEFSLFAAQKSPEHCRPVQTDVPHVAGKISSCRLGLNGDKLRQAPYLVKTLNLPPSTGSLETTPWHHRLRLWRFLRNKAHPFDC